MPSRIKVHYTCLATTASTESSRKYGTFVTEIRQKTWTPGESVTIPFASGRYCYRYAS